MRSGPRDDLITIERDTDTTENAFGEIQEGWTTYAIAWAQVVYGSGAERRNTATEGAEQTATFRVLACDETLGVTTLDRIQFGGIWDIVNVSPLLRDGVEYTAIRRTAA